MVRWELSNISEVTSQIFQYLATSDTDRCVTVFKQNMLLGTWELLGRYRGHTRHIVQIMFVSDPDTGHPLLVSLGKDLWMNEYCLERSSISEGLVLRHRSQVEQRCQPSSVTWIPTSASDEAFIIIANKVNIHIALIIIIIISEI